MLPEFSQEALIQFFGQFAYDPIIIYSFLIIFMVMSSFGFPIPEEVVLISVGLVAYLAQHPEIYAPPYAEASPVNPNLLAAIAFFAVFLSDSLVYTMGRTLGTRALRFKVLNRLLSPRRIQKIEKWSEKYGAFAAGIFRFTPGLRFPGHFMCGATKLPFSKFAAVDGTAALLSVPTQVLLIAYYGETILAFMKQFKIAILSIVALGILFLVLRRYKFFGLVSASKSK